jgi:F0F1-type ATP synthase assembly protein I
MHKPLFFTTPESSRTSDIRVRSVASSSGGGCGVWLGFCVFVHMLSMRCVCVFKEERSSSGVYFACILGERASERAF